LKSIYLGLPGFKRFKVPDLVPFCRFGGHFEP
jgi:hypothetical protein